MTERYPINHQFTGIPTFYKSPLCEDISLLDADVGMLGLPFDDGAGYWPGARFGPRAVREASTRYGFRDRGNVKRGYFDVDEGRRLLGDVTIADCGDIDVLYTAADYSIPSITATVRQVLDRGALPVVIGGNHTPTPGTVAAFEGLGQVDVVQFDAHIDYRDAVRTVRYHAGSPMRRISEMPFIRNIVQIGLRGWGTREEDYQESLARGNKIFTTRQARAMGAKAVFDACPKLQNVFVTFDMDVFDPSVAPGAGAPTPGGFAYDDARSFLRELSSRYRVVGYDLMEVNPMVDPTGTTAIVAAWLNLEFLAAIFDGGHRKPKAR